MSFLVNTLNEAAGDRNIPTPAPTLTSRYQRTLRAPTPFAATNTVAEGVRIYEAAFDYCTRRPYVMPTDDASSSAYVFTIDHIINLADLMLHIHDYGGHHCHQTGSEVVAGTRG